MRANIVGPVCETGDTFASGREIGRVEAGDLVVFRTAGAYAATMASTYNSRPLTPEVIEEFGRGQTRDERKPIKVATPKAELPDRDRVAAALQAAQGRVAQASSSLGLTSRYVLYRLIRQYGLDGLAATAGESA